MKYWKDGKFHFLYYPELGVITGKTEAAVFRGMAQLLDIRDNTTPEDGYLTNDEGETLKQALCQ